MPLLSILCIMPHKDLEEYANIFLGPEKEDSQQLSDLPQVTEGIKADVNIRRAFSWQQGGLLYSSSCGFSAHDQIYQSLGRGFCDTVEGLMGQVYNSCWLSHSHMSQEVGTIFSGKMIQKETDLQLGRKYKEETGLQLCVLF